MIRTKICGVTSVKDALAAAKYGVWAVGFNFYKRSPRYIGPYKARRIIQQLPPFVTPVGVFVDQKEGAVKDVLEFCNIHTVQFHGDESPAYCRRFNKYTVIKAFRVQKDFDIKQLKDFSVAAYLFDAHVEGQYGGSGQPFAWPAVRGAKNFGVPIILAGGLNPENVREAVSEVKPYAVDVASGVESAPGKKNERAVRLFMENVYS